MDRFQTILEDVTGKGEDLPGIAGVVLVGSRAKGTHRPDSDIDIGIDCDERKGFEVQSVGEIAAERDDEHRTNLITSLGERGPWVNGGRVAQVIDDCLKGIITAVG